MSIKSALAAKLEELLTSATKEEEQSMALQLRIAAMRELLNASTCKEVVTPDREGGSDNLTRLLSCSIGDTNYKTLELTDKGRGILRGVLGDLRSLHLTNRIHGSISMDDILVEVYPTSGGRKMWKGRLISLECIRYDDGAAKSQKIAEDFVMLANTIQDIFDHAGEKELPIEVKHLLDIMRTSATKEGFRAFIHNHPCTLTLLKKQMIISNIQMYYNTNDNCKMQLHKQQRMVPACIVRGWESTLMNLPTSTYKTLWETLENDLKPAPRKRGAPGQHRQVQPMDILAYYNCAFEHDTTIGFFGLINAMYILFPDFLCNFIEANVENTFVKMAAFKR